MSDAKEKLYVRLLLYKQMNQLVQVLLPVVTAFLMPLTVTVAPLIPFPSESFTTPFTPRWTCPHTQDTHMIPGLRR